jgi:hypothetical protein
MVGLYLDTFSQHVFGYKYKTAGSAKTTIDSLNKTFTTFAPWETFMLDGGRHFDNKEVRELCGKWGTKTHIVAAYSPWVNGLVKGAKNYSCTSSKDFAHPTWMTKKPGSWKQTTYQKTVRTTLMKLSAYSTGGSYQP